MKTLPWLLVAGLTVYAHAQSPKDGIPVPGEQATSHHVERVVQDASQATGNQIPSKYHKSVFDLEKVILPKEISDVVKQHIAAIQAFDSTAHLNKNNFYHGHFLLKGGHAHNYSSLEDFAKDVSVYLYHTHENDHDWDKNHTPRNIVGYPDGTIKVLDVPEEKKYEFRKYQTNGTVYPDELWRLIKNAEDSSVLVNIEGSKKSPAIFNFGKEGDNIEVFMYK